MLDWRRAKLLQGAYIYAARFSAYVTDLCTEGDDSIMARYVSGSPAMIADAAHSISDLVSDVITYDKHECRISPCLRCHAAHDCAAISTAMSFVVASAESCVE